MPALSSASVIVRVRVTKPTEEYAVSGKTDGVPASACSHTAADSAAGICPMSPRSNVTS